MGWAILCILILAVVLTAIASVIIFDKDSDY